MSYSAQKDLERIEHSTRKKSNLLYDINSFTKSVFISEKDLDIVNKTRSNQLPWKGQFSPQLIEVILQYFVNNKSQKVLDPFLGSGTVILESSRFGLSSIGTEINPAAYYLSSLYKFINIKDRQEILQRIEDKILSMNSLAFPLFANNTKSNSCENELILMSKSANSYEEKIIINALIVLLDFFNNKVTHEYLLKVWTRLKKIIVDFPYAENEIQIYNCDARKIPIKANSVDLVITSPPYINVFNYHQQYRSSVESLGWNLLHVAKSEIGSNRKHRSNRFLTVIQYVIDMYYVFHELLRVTKNNADIIFIIGRESNVRKTPFLNSEIVSSVGILAGLDKPTWQDRKYINRFGQTIYEDIIYFRGRELVSIDEMKCRDLAREILNKAMIYAPDESMSDLMSAINLSSSVLHSQIYEVA